MHRPLSRLFDAESLAIVGASPREGTPSWRVMEALRRYSYAGQVIPVNEKYHEVGGFRCYPSIEALGAQVDQALVLTPPARLLEVAHDAGRSGVGAISVLAAGFAELGPEGLALEAELAATVASYGMRLLGPNSLGVMNLASGLVAAPSSAFETIEILRGTVSILSQSGAVGSLLVSQLSHRGVGVRYYASTGNEADIALGECIEHVAGDPGTEVLVLYIEGLRDGARAVAAMQRARENGKQVVALKVGRSELGAAAVRSHTAAIAGDDAVYAEMMRRVGAVRCHTVRDVVDTVASYGIARKVRRLHGIGVLTISGGLGALAAEQLAEAGFDLPSLPSDAQRQMRDVIPYSVPRNPVDATGQISAEPEKFRRFLALMVEQAQFDGLVVVLAYAGENPRLMSSITQMLIDLHANVSTPIALVGSFTAEIRSELMDADYFVCEDSAEAVRWLRCLRDLVTARTAGIRQVHLADLGDEVPGATVVHLPDDESFAMLRDYGIRVADWVAGPAVSIREVDGPTFPVVLKRLEPGVLHKTELGLVRPDIAGPEELAEAMEEMELRVGAGGRYLLQQQVQLGGSHELVLSARRDPQFGSVIVLGYGGRLAEFYADTAIVLPPFDHAAVAEALGRLRHAPVLLGFRGSQPVDVRAVTEAVEALAGLMTQRRDVVEVEINPIVAGPVGTDAVGVDAVIGVRPEETEEMERSRDQQRN